MTMSEGDARRRDLLLAIFGDDAESLMAWGRWQLHTNLDALSRSEFGLMPALSRRLESHGISHPWITRLRGVRRYCWTANQVTRRDALAVFSALSQAGVDAVAPSGLPLIARLYDDFAGRLADHVDVLVLPDAIAAADATLSSLGWSPHTPLPPADLRSVCGPVTYVREGHRHVLLHWHCAPAPITAATNRAIFSRRQPVPRGTDGVEMLDDVDQLVLTCVHHRRFARDDTLVWVADTLSLLRHLQATSRQALIWERANALGVGRRFAESITDVHALVGDALPFVPSVDASLMGTDDPRVAVLLDQPTGGGGMRRAWARARLRYDAWSASVGATRSVGGFLRFSTSLYRYDWNVSSWMLPLATLQRLYGRRVNEAPTGEQMTMMSSTSPSVVA